MGVYETVKIKHLKEQENPVGSGMAGELLKAEKKKVMKRMVRAILFLQFSAAKENFIRYRQYYG